MTLDSSGNLLVGTTGTDPNNATTSGDAGMAIRSDGRVLNGVYQAFAADFNRINNDGEIVRLSKDGSTVGSIGTTSGGLYVNGTSSVNLYNGTHEVGFGTGAIAGNGSGNDAVIDLGRNNRRFKDLYLSGGVYLGGTGSANKLDDYEEGTWTPTMAGLTTSLEDGYYTKVGNLVTAQFRISSSSITDSSSAYISNLPFTVANAGDAGRSAGFLSYQNTGTWYGLLFGSGQNAAYFRSLNGATATRTAISGSLLWGTLVYQTS